MIVIVLFSICVGLFLLHTMRRPKNFLPGPPLLPLIGNLSHAPFKDVNEKAKSLHEIYGDFGLIVPFFKVIFLKSSRTIRDLFSNEDFTARVDVHYNRDRFDGKNLGIIFVDGDFMNVNKKFAVHNFRNFGMGKLRQETIILDETESLINEISKFNSEPLNFEPLLAFANMNITWTIVGGEKFPYSDPKLKIFTEALTEVVRSFVITGDISVFVPAWRYLFPSISGHSKYMELNKLIRHFVREAIDDHIKTREPNDPRDFIDAYLDEMDTKSVLSDKYMFVDQLEATVYDIIVAATGTTSTLMTFTIMFLAIHQNIQQKLFEEIETNLGLTNSPCGKDKIKLPYCQAVLHEMLRIRPPVPIVMPHQASKDTKLGAYDIPKGTIALINLEELFVDKDIWGDPETFRPERFINEDGGLEVPDIFLPFGKGKRKCAGEVQAKLTAFLMLSRLVQKFSFQLPVGHENQSTNGSKAFVMSPPVFNVIAVARSAATK